MKSDDPVQRCGPYELFDCIGQGRISEVYRASLASQRAGAAARLALKRMPAELPGAPRWPELFSEAALRATLLTHANIVRVFDFGRADGACYVTMELIEGYDLAWVLTRQAARDEELPLRIALAITLALCAALDHAQRARDERGRPVAPLHGNVRPSNVLLLRSGQVKLADFGVGEALRRSAEISDDPLAGAYAYMAPEQLRGDAVDQHADTFAVATLLYEMVCAKPPFGSHPERVAMAAALDGALLVPSAVNAALPSWLDAVLLKGLARAPHDRYASAAALAAHLESFAARSCGVAQKGEVATWLDDLAADFVADEPDTTEEALPTGRLHGLIHPPQRPVLEPEPALGEVGRATRNTAGEMETTPPPAVSPVPTVPDGDEHTLATFAAVDLGLSRQPTAPRAEIVSSQLADPPRGPIPELPTDDEVVFDDETKID